MPLDTGGITDLHRRAEDGRAPDLNASNESYAPTLHSGADIGQALRAVRESRGLTLEDLAEITRVRRAYLAAIEELRLELLPSRPFTIGYIRAYASALGLDAEVAVERFKADEPVLDEPLHEPLGVQEDRDPRLTAIIAGGCVIIAAIVLWNIAQRAMTESAPPSPTAPQVAAAHALAAAKAGPVSLGAPLPAPVESTTPPPYETPGLAEAATGADGKITLDGRPKVLDHLTEAPADETLTPVFQAKGAIFGAPPSQTSAVTVQALKSASMIVRGADGSVYFARQLAAGEAYRAPQIGGLTFDVSTPNAFQVFVGGQSKGVLPSAQTSVSALAGG
ncbi:helix-turn-helix domain-containing protein [Phenylobacterium hankyongense]|uniref:Helix-turn-helix domain-containing protein n=1 Tax=Phenylobacterium hankyongense TaxID=1813876 RepID=A0A328AVQ3_9CAUL|nr:helix-turn-helix domain-containing protein [Phenylobacterium hankyongense]RAK58677.1 helix-turn-helix domain-containing protein [Phenylobacterium hankyongense]